MTYDVYNRDTGAKVNKEPLEYDAAWREADNLSAAGHLVSIQATAGHRPPWNIARGARPYALRMA